MDAQNDLSAWISSIPMITKYWFFSYFLVPLTTRLGLISPINLLLFSDAVFYKFEVAIKSEILKSYLFHFPLLDMAFGDLPALVQSELPLANAPLLSLQLFTTTGDRYSG